MHLVERGLKTAQEALNIKSGFIKSKLEKVIGFKLKFYSYPGKPDIVALSEFSIIYLFHALIDSTLKSTETMYEKSESRIDV